MKMLRKALFWLHLACGVVAGVVIVIMSATGVAIAFEHEILAWIDRDVARVTAPDGTAPKSLAELDLALAAQHPDFQTSQVLAEVCHTRVIIPDCAEDSSTRILSLRDGQTVLQLALPAVRGIAVNLQTRSGPLHIISPGDSVLLTLAAAAGEVAAADWRGAAPDAVRARLSLFPIMITTSINTSLPAAPPLWRRASKWTSIAGSLLRNGSPARLSSSPPPPKIHSRNRSMVTAQSRENWHFAFCVLAAFALHLALIAAIHLIPD